MTKKMLKGLANTAMWVSFASAKRTYKLDRGKSGRTAMEEKDITIYPSCSIHNSPTTAIE